MEVLSRWAILANNLSLEKKQKAVDSPKSFDLALSGLILRSKILRSLQQKDLSALIEKSENLLVGLGEPLCRDLGIQSALKDKREESYSRWLFWALSRLSCHELISVLGLRKEFANIILTNATLPVIKREEWVPHGHEEKSGRLDLLIEVGLDAIVVIEVKVGPPANTEKQLGYRKSFDDTKFPQLKKFFLLLVTKSENKTDNNTFDVRLWSTFCRNLRRVAVDWIKNEGLGLGRGRLEAAILLATVSAFEQNLLGFSASVDVRTSDTISHLEKFVEDMSYEQC